MSCIVQLIAPRERTVLEAGVWCLFRQEMSAAPQVSSVVYFAYRLQAC